MELKKLQQIKKQILPNLQYLESESVSYASTLRSKLDCLELELKMKQVYGYEIKRSDFVNSLLYFRIHDYAHVTHFDDAKKDHEKGRGYSISWSDDGRQPLNETLLVLSFPTGAYIFDKDYPKPVFKEFFDELRTYNPKYSDSHNSSLYFELKKGAKVFNDFWDIFNKHKKKVDDWKREEKVKRLQKELEDLTKQ